MHRNTTGRYPRATAFLAALLFVGLTGCGPAMERLPTELGGMPANAPKRTPDRPPTPPVYGGPPPRADAMTPEDALKLQQELSDQRQKMTPDPTVRASSADEAAKAVEAMEKAKAEAKRKASKPNQTAPR